MLWSLNRAYDPEMVERRLELTELEKERLLRLRQENSKLFKMAQDAVNGLRLTKD
jgi:hypothetical protein